MKIAVIGSGGREHALVKQLKKSPECTDILAIPGNGGISQECLCVPLSVTDLTAVSDYCFGNNVDYVVVAPDDPLALGMVDALAKRGIPAFGPSKAAARIEASKAFSKKLMKKYGIPTADYRIFSDLEPALKYVEALCRFPVVVKADGLALGKGVLVCETRQDAFHAVKTMMVDQSFGRAGSTIVIEEFLQGPEVSVLAFCDGECIVPMISSMDHKRALDGDNGKNTGGMGAVAPNPYYTDEIAQECMNKIYLATIKAMKAEGCPFSGCLYFGLMLTKAGPKVIEYNARFGDPEAQVILPLLQSDLLNIMIACTNGTLHPQMVQFSSESAACVVMSGKGYPEACQTGYPISGLENAKAEGLLVYQAGTVAKNGAVITSGGRVLAVSATAPNLKRAIQRAYQGVEKIHFENAHYRRDIGVAAMNGPKN